MFYGAPIVYLVLASLYSMSMEPTGTGDFVVGHKWKLKDSSCLNYRLNLEIKESERRKMGRFVKIEDSC